MHRAHRQRAAAAADHRSIAEAEVNSSDYYGKVTRVILNRLDRDMTLGMDSTTAYGLGINGTQLTNAQLNDSSNKYNTTRQQGTHPHAHQQSGRQRHPGGDEPGAG